MNILISYNIKFHNFKLKLKALIEKELVLMEPCLFVCEKIHEKIPIKTNLF
jgi:hypothetical protein